MSNDPRIRIECTDCNFSRVVHPGDDEHPHEIIIRHGQEMGHKLSTETGEDEASVSP